MNFKKVIAAALLATSTSCASQMSVGVPPTPVGADAAYYLAGDSLVMFANPWLARPTFTAAVGGNGFVYQNTGTIESVLLEKMGSNHPSVVMVLGGINDNARQLPLGDTLAAMQHLEDTMTARGIRTVWITEPTWLAEPFLSLQNATNTWMISRPFHQDCAPITKSVVGAGTIDGFHPNGPSSVALAGCIDAVI